MSLNLNVEDANNNSISLEDCYNNAWVCLLNKPQKLQKYVCAVCKQIANNAVELHCGQHAEVYIIGEKCLKNHLKNNKEKCPIENHQGCKYSEVRFVRQDVNALQVICPRQYKLGQYKGKIQTHRPKMTDEGMEEDGSEEKNGNVCNYQGTIKSLYSHLEGNCKLKPFHCEFKKFGCNTMLNQSHRDKHMLSEMKEHLDLVDKHINELQNDLTKLRKENNDLHLQLTKKQSEVEGLTEEKNELNAQILQYQQQSQVKPQLIVEKKEEKTEEKVLRDMADIDSKQLLKSCQDMIALSSLVIPALQNTVDYLLISEDKRKIKLKNNQWNNFRFGIYLLGEGVILTADCGKSNNATEFELGYLMIKTSHLWIKHKKSAIDCSGLGYPSDLGPGKGGQATTIGNGSVGGGGGYGTKGGEGTENGDGKGGDVYGEETLSKQIFCGSGGGTCREDEHIIHRGGRGGGVIELVVEQQLINHGKLQCNGKRGEDSSTFGGGGSGGSILIKLQSHNALQHTMGNITCTGGNHSNENKGGDGRVAIYGIKITAEEMKNINPKPFHQIRLKHSKKNKKLNHFK
ncbi:hypothetical protein RFI_16098 [Reticulomyxa filosa]|uniref:TRAF-type domain-containing protein n=1 Tax=Reticulomyxa filosa TaxID=46433 RepID=X6N584_RETFI|nr:hypothetical protein RFI_16098 [Reticulomyxa filosa]|eukprot:ETO21108.1 hypothetical protein RFI_16098 [Reticulomyxa filosa]